MQAFSPSNRPQGGRQASLSWAFNGKTCDCSSCYGSTPKGYRGQPADPWMVAFYGQNQIERFQHIWLGPRSNGYGIAHPKQELAKATSDKNARHPTPHRRRSDAHDYPLSEEWNCC